MRQRKGGGLQDLPLELGHLQDNLRSRGKEYDQHDPEIGKFFFIHIVKKIKRFTCQVGRLECLHEMVSDGCCSYLTPMAG